MAETQTRRHARGNGNFKPTLLDLDQRIDRHEQDDRERHEAINKAIGGVGTDVKEMKGTLTIINTEREAEVLFEKWKQKWLIGGLTVAGVIIPLGTAIWDHWGKA